MIELAIGMLALALVTAALLAFAHYIATSLDQQREVRAAAGRPALNAFGDRTYSSARRHEQIEVPALAAGQVFGRSEVEVSEEAHLPAMGGILQ